MNGLSKIDIIFSTKNTKAVKFHNGNSNSTQIKPKLQINNTETEYTDTINFLGLTFDSRLKWDRHINSVKQS